MERRIGHYRIVSELGRGGMGVVYLAHEESLNRHVAIKVLGSHLAAEPGYVERFVREAQSAAKLNHPNIVQIYAIDEQDGTHFFVMEYVSGTSLHARLRSGGGIDTAEAMSIVLQAAGGLQAAHDLGVIHRDVKPANLLIDDRGLVKITDFGLALSGAAAARLTATGMLMGTPGYLSPEQCRDETVDHRTDIYSLGVTLHETLTGSMPFTADSPLALLKQIMEVEPPDVCELRPEVDAEARGILLRMMAKDRDLRYQDCHELMFDLRTWIGQRGSAAHDPESLAVGAPADAVAEPPESADHGEVFRLETDPTVVVESGGQSPGAPVAAAPVATAPTDDAPQGPPSTAPSRRRRTALVVAAILLLGVIALAAGVVVVRKGVGLLQAKLAADRAPVAAAALPDADGGPPAADAADTGGRTEIGPSLASPSPVAALTSVGEDQAPVESSGAPDTEEPAPVAEGSTPDRGSTAPDAAAREADRAASPHATQPRSVVAPPDAAVVIALGESLLAGEAEAYLERALRNRGRTVVDTEDIPGLTELRRDQPPPRGYLRELLLPHASHLVLVRAEYLGDRPLSYMGRRDAAYQSRLDVAVIDLATGRPAVQPFSRRIEYTHLSVERVVSDNLGRWLRRSKEKPGG